MNYSNSGYLLLGLIVERASGQSYADFVRTKIFVPLGMQDSGYDSNTEILPRRAAGYSPGPAGIANAQYVDMTIPHGAGALYSTTEDLLRWTRGLFGGRLLSAASLGKMTTPGMGNYGFGVNVGTTRGDRSQVGHRGFNTG